jgi:hypothetical protein
MKELTHLCLPNEVERTLWQRSENGVWIDLGKDASVEDCVFGIDVLALDCMPFWAMTPEDGQFNVESVATLRWESLGAVQQDAGKPWISWTVTKQDNRVLISTAGLSAESMGATWPEWKPKSFEITPRLFPFPDDEAALWMELGHLVLAVHRGKELVHFTGLNATKLDAEAAKELRDTLRILEARDLISDLKGVRVWTEASADFTKSLKTLLGVNVTLEAKPAPVLPSQPCELMPPGIALSWRTAGKQRQQMQLFFALAACYMLFFIAWSGWLEVRELRLQSVVAEQTKHAPEIAQIHEAQAQWQALESAVNPDNYPAEIFHRIVSLLPNEGIRLKELTIELQKLVVSGEASTVGHAMKFKADLTNNEGLKNYGWNFPMPTILEDNRASFRAEGSVNTGGAEHEGQ